MSYRRLEDISNKDKINGLREQLHGEGKLRPEPNGYTQLISPELSPKLDPITESDTILPLYTVSNGHSEGGRDDGRHNLVRGVSTRFRTGERPEIIDITTTSG